MTEKTIKIKGLIKGEVCMGTYGLVELELLDIEKELDVLHNISSWENIYLEFCEKVGDEYGIHSREFIRYILENFNPIKK